MRKDFFVGVSLILLFGSVRIFLDMGVSKEQNQKDGMACIDF